MTKDEAIQALAHCLKKAEHLSKRARFSEAGRSDEIYWWTRELLPVACRRSGVRLIHVLQACRDIAFLSDSALSQRASPFWDEIGHPDIVESEVAEAVMAE